MLYGRLNDSTVLGASGLCPYTAFKPQNNNKSWSGVSFLQHTQVITIETVNLILYYLQEATIRQYLMEGDENVIDQSLFLKANAQLDMRIIFFFPNNC